MRIKFFLLIVLFQLNTGFACELLMRVYEGPPLTFQNGQKEWVGLDIELASALTSKVGCKLKFKGDLHWKRAIHHLMRGKLDVMANLSFTKERAKSIFFVGPIRNEKVILVMRKDNPVTLNSLDDFKKLHSGSIGIGLGSYYGAEFANKFKNDNEFSQVFSDSPNDIVNFVRLKDKKIIGFISDYHQITHKLKTDKDFELFSINPFIINSAPVYLGLSKKSVDYELILELKSALKKEVTKQEFIKIQDAFSTQ